jgi:hypothetical protein
LYGATCTAICTFFITQNLSKTPYILLDVFSSTKASV